MKRHTVPGANCFTLHSVEVHRESRLKDEDFNKDNYVTRVNIQLQIPPFLIYELALVTFPLYNVGHFNE
jgi:hypothetical protein